jgi:hypothetical protein
VGWVCMSGLSSGRIPNSFWTCIIPSRPWRCIWRSALGCWHVCWDIARSQTWWQTRDEWSRTCRAILVVRSSDSCASIGRSSLGRVRIRRVRWVIRALHTVVLHHGILCRWVVEALLLRLRLRRWTRSFTPLFLDRHSWINHPIISLALLISLLEGFVLAKVMTDTALPPIGGYPKLVVGILSFDSAVYLLKIHSPCFGT